MEWSKARKGRGKRQLRGAPGSESAGESLNHPLIDPNCPIHTLPLESRISQEISVEYASEEEDDEEEDEARESDSIRSMAEGTRQFGESAAGGSVAAGVSRTANHADGGVASRRPKKAITLRFDHFLGAAAKRLGVGRFSFARRGRWMDSMEEPVTTEPMTTRAILARIMASRDPDALERAGGGPALASMVARVVSGDPSDGAKLLVGDEYAEVTVTKRRKIFGSNRIKGWISLKGANFVEFFLEELQQENVVVLLSCSLISVAFGLIECQGGFFDPDSDVGNVIGDSCPLRPLWVGRGNIHLPNTTSALSSSDAVSRGDDDASAQCLAWLGGAMAFVACLSFVALKAASEDWQIKRLCIMGEWEAEGLRSTVLRGGKEVRIPAGDVVVGDIVLLYEGDVVPADGVLLSGISLSTDENWATPLAGRDVTESRVVPKRVGTGPFMLAGTYVVSGEGRMLVCAVGMCSQYARSACNGPRSLHEKSSETPLRRQLERLASTAQGFSIWGAGACLAACCLVSAVLTVAVETCFEERMENCRYGYPGLNDQTACELNGLEWGPEDEVIGIHQLRKLVDYVTCAAALLTLLVPNGLTSAMSVFTAGILNQCRKESVEIKSFHALEVMGNVTTVCVEKQGCLSAGVMWIETTNVCGVRMKYVESHLDQGIARSTGLSRNLLELVEEARGGEVRWPTTNGSGGLIWKLLGECIALNATSRELGERRAGGGGVKKGVKRGGGGSMVDKALLDALGKLSIDAMAIRRDATIIRRWPFSKQTRRGCVLIKLPGGGGRAYMIGAIDAIRPRCTTRLMADGQISGMDDKAEADLGPVLSEITSRGLHSVAFAYRDIPNPDALAAFCTPQSKQDPDMWAFDGGDEEGQGHDTDPVLHSWLAHLNEYPALLCTDMTFLGVFGLSAPLSGKTKAAAELCRAAGVNVRVMSGSCLRGAVTDAVKSGIWEEGSTSCEASEWRFMKSTDRSMSCRPMRVVALASPEDKTSFVQHLQHCGHIVAAQGDSADDVETLRQADASLAPKGRGDEGARYQADIVCLDDGLHSIMRAIVRGRLLHKNIRSYVQYRITVSIVTFITIFAGCLSGCAFLFSPLQIIWIKLVSDVGSVIAMAPTAKVTDDARSCGVPLMPYPRAMPIINSWAKRGIIIQALYQTLSLSALFVCGRYVLKDCTGESCVNLLENGQGQDGSGIYLVTLLFNSLVMCQLAHLISSMTFAVEAQTSPSTVTSPFAVAAVASIATTQFLVVQTGGWIMGTVRLDATGWLITFAIAGGSVIVSAAHTLYDSTFARKASLEEILHDNSVSARDADADVAVVEEEEEEGDVSGEESLNTAPATGEGGEGGEEVEEADESAHHLDVHEDEGTHQEQLETEESKRPSWMERIWLRRFRGEEDATEGSGAQETFGVQMKDADL